MHDDTALTLAATISGHATNTPDHAAILAPDRRRLTYRQLSAQIQSVGSRLNSVGIRRNDRVAIVLPNGPELAVAILAVSAAATSAPLNPGYRAAEFEFFLSDMDAKGLILLEGIDSPARTVAQTRGIPVFELSPDLNREAGMFTLGSASAASVGFAELAQPNDVALLLHTSGTTSRPKQVPLTHSNLLASAGIIAGGLELRKKDVCLNVMPLFHIHGLVGAFFSSLFAGASVAFPGEFNAPRFQESLEEFQATWYTAVPTMHKAIVEHAREHQETAAPTCLRFIRSSSAPLPPNVMRELEALCQVPVIEAYGMTEASHQIAANPLPPGRRKAGSVGLPLGTEVAVLDDAGKTVPAGRSGEILIRGANVARGYDNDSPGDAGAFVNGWFRTGDLGFFDEDGYLFITGRLKEIINRGGEKVSPSEVDQAIIAHHAVAQVVTFGMPHGKLGEEVAAAVVPCRNTSITEREIQQFAAERLAEYKVPRRVVIVDEIPKSAAGKPQRIGLAEKLGITASDRTGADARPALVPPRNQVEKALANIWSQVLRVHPIGVHDNFFDLGGDSLLASQVISRVRDNFKVELSFLVFFDAATLADVAESIASAKRKDADAQSPPISRVPRDGEMPLSFAQQRLWFFDQLNPGSPAYNRPVFLRLRGRLVTAALEKSLDEIIQRHEIVRTRFPSVDGLPRQVVWQPPKLTLTTVDLREQPQAIREAEAQRLAIEEGQRPFDLTSDILLRAELLRLGDEEHILVVTTHHIASDGWSDGILYRELAALFVAFCDGKPSPLFPLSIQYGDFAVWQNRALQQSTLEAHLAYWKQQLAGAPPALELPTDRPRPPIQTFHGARHSMRLPHHLSDALRNISRREDVTLYMVLLAAFQVLVYRCTAQHDIVIGTPIAGRNNVETESLIGAFINTLVLRTDLSGDPSFRELLRRVRKVCLEAYEHVDMPIEMLVEELKPKRDASRNPLFQVMFQLRNEPKEAAELRGLKVNELDFDIGLAKVDLTLEIVEKKEGLTCCFEYNTDLFDSATIVRMSGHFLGLLQSVVADPARRIGQLSMLTDAERHQLVGEWNDTRREYPKGKCIHQLFEEQAERTPDAIAVEFQDQRLTYKDLNRRANQLAHYLKKLDVGPEVPVGICVERSLEMVVGILGVLKAGAAYVPQDPSFPKERLAFMWEDTQVSVVLTQERLIEKLPSFPGRLLCLDRDWEQVSSESDANFDSGATAENLAYIIYTSGSTGRPKGVQILHYSVVNAITHVRETLQFSERDVLPLLGNICFDISVMEILLPLSAGGRLVVASAEVAVDGERIAQLLSTSGATSMHATPATWRLLLQARWPGHRKLTMLSGGEALPIELADRLTSRGSSLWNMYGPTEATIYSSAAPYRAGLSEGPVSIGRPIGNTQIYIVDDHLQPVPVGVPGQLYIGGEGLARGYLNRAELTAESFVPNPFSKIPGARLYKTGDLARYLPDGNVGYLGRIDFQVKLRGFRIELGEIEAVLDQHEKVCQSIVLAREDVPGDNQLAAYVVIEQGAAAEADELRGYLKSVLPDYMVPSAFVFLKSFPLTSNGKLDREAFPAPDPNRRDIEEAFVAPHTPTEKVIADIWSEVLKLRTIGTHDNFFDLGGHSLLAVKAISRICEALEVRLSLRSFFVEPTVAGLAKLIATIRWTGQDDQGSIENQEEREQGDL